jgi:ATP-binding cassette subfamily F protein 3
MNILTVSKLRKEFNAEVLFENISFEINSKDKIALIGKNGTGKSTLLKILLGEMEYDSGEFHINNKASIGYLSQDVISRKNHTLLEEMLDVFSDLINMEEKLKSYTKILEKDPHNQEVLQQYTNLEHIFQMKEGYEYHYKIDLILSKFGFDKEWYERSISSFSGGEKTRVAFAKLLLMNPDLLILDEPTNHLDIEIIEWLEDYLNKYSGAVLVVTHDKYFISKVCKNILEIDHQTIHQYTGSYETYEEEKIKRYEIMMKKYTRQQKELAHLQSFIDRFRYNSKRASLAKDRQKKIDRIDKIDKPHMTKRKVKMEFDERRVTRDIILQADKLSIGYDVPLFENINFSMRGTDKLAIIGPNGTGKTTLLKVIEKKLAPLSGKVSFLRQYKIGYFDQNQETLHLNKTIFEEIHDYYPMFTNYDIRSVAARFLFFGEDLDKPISILSGGEKVRLVLLLLMLEKPELLILDEPTNHLDIETKDIIEDVFYSFTGPIIFVSHDRYFINRIGTKLLHISNDKTVTEFIGTYDDLKDQLAENAMPKEQKKSTKKKQRNFQKEIKELETKIHNLEDELKQLKEDSFLEENYLDHRKMNKISSRIEEIEEELEDVFEEYMTVQEEHEVINNGTEKNN